MNIEVHRIVALVACVLAVGCGESQRATGPENPPPDVSAPVETVAATPFDVAYDAVGTTRSKMVATIESKTLGHVVRVLVAEGDRVDADALLVEVDDRDMAAQLREAESAHAVALEALQAIEQSVRASASALEAAEANLALAKATYERQKNLLGERVVSRQAYDEAEARYRTSEAEVQGARDTLKSYEAKQRETVARIQQSAAGVDGARVSLGYTKLTAPFTGIITMKSVDVGDLVSPGVPLLEVEDARHYRLEALVDESHLTAVRLGDSVAVQIDALGTESLKGTVAEIVPKADPTSRSSLVKIDLPDHDALRSGLFGRAAFTGKTTETITVPRSAVFERGQLTGVYALDASGIARLRLIKTGRTFGERIEVLSGLNAGELVVVGNLEAVSDGVHVTHP